jgi:ribonucleoside-diphosphate reductase alpha chain
VSERKRLPDTRRSITRKLTITYPSPDGSMLVLKMYVTVGFYDDGAPGEIFIRADHMGSTVSGLLDALAVSMSIGLQSGVPINWYIDKLKNMRFEPEGPTNDPDIKRSTSIVDAVARWLEKYLKD